MAGLLKRSCAVSWLLALALSLPSLPATAAVVGPVLLQSLPDCPDASGQHLNYTGATGAFGCGATLAPLPDPSAGVLGGILSATGPAHQWMTGVSTAGAPLFAQPSAADIAGLAASATTDTTNATNISSGTLGAARLPMPTAVTLGGVESLAPAAHQFLTGISTAGAPIAAPLQSNDVTTALGFAPLSTAGGTLTGPLTTNGSINGNGGARPAAQADDSTAPFAVNSEWRDSQGHVFQLQDATTGFATWQQVQSAVLPLDAVGLNVSAATYTSGGASCAANEVLTFTGGATIKVLTCSAGVPATWSITNPQMLACMPGSPSSLTPLATTGGDGSSVWNFTIQSAVGAYGTRQLTKCYSGHALQIYRSDTAENINIDFLADGSLDTKTLDSFTAGGTPMAQYPTYASSNAGSATNPRTGTWNDQSGNANNAPQNTPANRPTIFPGRTIGNARSIMIDGDGSQWDPALTFLNLPAGVSVAGNNNTVAVLGGCASENSGCDFVHVGAQASAPLILQVIGSIGPQYQNGSSTKVTAAAGAPDEGTLYIGQSTPSATTLYVGNVVTTSGVVGQAGTVSSGTIGEFWNTSTSPLADVAAVIIFPWALSTAQINAFQISMYNTFGITPQKRGIILALGDSHVANWGKPYQQDFPRQAMAILGRPDVSLVNIAAAGGNISAFVGAKWTSMAVPALGAYTANKFVMLQGGYNDLTGGQTLVQVEGTYTTLSGNAHSAGAKVICDTDTIRNGALALNQNMQALGTWMQQTPSVCDYVLNPQVYSVFNAASGPWNLPWFEQQDGGVHLSAAGDALMGAIFAADLAQWLQF